MTEGTVELEIQNREVDKVLFWEKYHFFEKAKGKLRWKLFCFKCLHVNRN